MKNVASNYFDVSYEKIHFYFLRQLELFPDAGMGCAWKLAAYVFNQQHKHVRCTFD